jgi:Spy/CpxP family protein refolding chaperone
MFRRLLTITAIVTALAGTAAMAQGLGVRSARAGRQLRRGALGGANLDRLQQRLNLTDVQLNGIRALQENRRKEMESLRQDIQDKRQALRQLVQQPNPNPVDVGNATLALKDIRERTREINQRFLSGVKGLLTPDQLQKLPKRLQ